MARWRLVGNPIVPHSGIPRRIKLALVGLFLLALVFVIIVHRRAKDSSLRQSIARHVIDRLDHVVNETLANQKDFWLSTNIPEGIVFSAYLDSRPEILLSQGTWNETIWGVVRIIAIFPLHMHASRNVDCIYRYETGKDSIGIRRRPAASVQAISENWGMTYSAFFVLCDLPVPNDVGPDVDLRPHIPTAIGLSRNDIHNLSSVSFVEIHYPKKSLEDDRDVLAVCVHAFHSEYDDSLRLVEFVEYYRSLGAGQITFYNLSISANVDRVLQYYVDDGIATVLPWELPATYKSEENIRLDGIFAALNDCLYRSSFYNKYIYVAVVDVDEFIVPKIHDNFRELLDYLDPETSYNPFSENAAFLFRNAFFYSMYENDTEKKVEDAPFLYTQAKTRRVKIPNAPKIRSKYIARSRDVVELGNHQVWEFRRGSLSYFHTLIVPEDVGLSHHYRDCEIGEEACRQKETIIDRSAHKFVDRYTYRVAAVCMMIFGYGGCTPTTNNENLDTGYSSLSEFSSHAGNTLSPIYSMSGLDDT